MKTSKGGDKILGTVRSPMSHDLVNRPMVPDTAMNTTIKGSAPRSAPINSPQAPFVSMGRSGRKSKR